MERKDIYISDTDNQIMPTILSCINRILFGEKKYEDKLLERYEDMKEQCNWEFPDGPTDNGCAVKYIDAPKDYQDYSILGFDIPTLIRLDNKPISNIVMVVSQDPRRTERYKGKLSLSSPFGFHDKSYRESARKGFMTPIILQALEDMQETAVYMTDCNKLFTTDKRKILKADIRKYQEILQKEIELIKPTRIIAHGNAAESALGKLGQSPIHIRYIGNSHMMREDREQEIANFIKAIKNNNK